MLVAEVADEHGERVGQRGDPVVGRQCSQAGETDARSGEPHRELALLVPEDVHGEGTALARRERMSPRECPDPRGVVASDSVGGKEPVDVLGGQRPDHQFAEQGAPSGRRAPGRVRPAAADQQGRDAGREGAGELVADPAVEQVEALEAVDHQDVNAAAAIRSAAAVADCGGGPPRALPSAASAPGTVGSMWRPSRLTQLTARAARVPVTSVVLPIPPARARIPPPVVRGEQCGQARTFLGPADQGCGHSSRQTV